MARNDIPDEHHLVRYISWAKLLKDEFDNVTGVLPEAFTLRDDEPFLSAAWQEYYRCSEIEQIQRTIRCMRTHGKKAGSKSAFAFGQVNSIKQACDKLANRIRVLHEPDGQFECHAAVRRWPREPDSVFISLADSVWNSLVMNCSVP